MASDNIQLRHQDHQPVQKATGLQLLADNLDNPSNIGSLFRMADALGVERVLLSGSSPCPPNRKLRTASRSAEKYVRYDYLPKADRFVSQLRASGYRLVALEITSSSKDIRDLKCGSNEKICLVLGNENAGVSEFLLSACSDTVHIPMLGNNSSMNVAMAAGIACFEILRSRLASC